MKKAMKIQAVIGKCIVDYLTPLALMYGVYVVFHGHKSPGGGFQGGVLIASVILFVYLGYGKEGIRRSFKGHFLHITQESFEILYSLIALAGIIFGFRFGFNFMISDSLETTMLMNACVGFIVASRLITLILEILMIPEEEGEKGGETQE